MAIESTVHNHPDPGPQTLKSAADRRPSGVFSSSTKFGSYTFLGKIKTYLLAEFGSYTFLSKIKNHFLEKSQQID